MVATFRRGGVTSLSPRDDFAPPSGRLQGNQVPGQSGWSFDAAMSRAHPGPHPVSQKMGGQVGVNDGTWGADPTRAKVSPRPRSTEVGAWDEGDPGSAPGVSPAPLGYAGGGNWQSYYDEGYGSGGFGQRSGRDIGGDPRAHGRPSWWRGGIQGFNDRLTVKDRHAYWDTGYQRTGTTGYAPAGSPNTYNDPMSQPPTAELRTVNRTVSYQKGTDTTRNADDLSRPYTWLGEQGSGWTPIPGGVPGLYMPYGTRGGVPYPVVDPTGGQGGREQVWSGPPHGLHSLTYPDMGDTLDRYLQNVQMQPVRLDRPSNSPIAGQSFSQTVQYQGATAPGAAAGKTGAPGHMRVPGRGWAGAQPRHMGRKGKG